MLTCYKGLLIDVDQELTGVGCVGWGLLFCNCFAFIAFSLGVGDLFLLSRLLHRPSHYRGHISITPRSGITSRYMTFLY